MYSRTRWPGSDPEGTLSKGEVFDVLQNKRRRYVIQYFRLFGAPVDLHDLATQIAAWEYGTPVDEVSNEHRERVSRRESTRVGSEPHGEVLAAVTVDVADLGPVTRGRTATRCDSRLVTEAQTVDYDV